MKLAQKAICTSGGGTHSLYLVNLTKTRMGAENLS